MRKEQEWQNMAAQARLMGTEGDEGRALLYAAVLPYLRIYARRYTAFVHRSGAVDFEDLYQSGYFGMVQATESYAPERGSFLAHLQFCVRKEMAAALGLRGRMRKEFYTCNSDEALANHPDEASERRAKQWERRRYIRRLMGNLPPEEKRVISKHYFSSVPLSRLGGDKAYRLHRAALARMRREIDREKENGAEDTL